MRQDRSVRRPLLLVLLGLIVIGLSGCTAEDDGNGTSGGGDGDGGIYAEGSAGDAAAAIPGPAGTPGHDTLKYGHT